MHIQCCQLFLKNGDFSVISGKSEMPDFAKVIILFQMQKTTEC